MQQSTRYPDPTQLRAFVQEPMPFDDILTDDLTLTDDDSLVASVENVTYVFDAAYINVETAIDEWHRVKDVSWSNIDHEQAWEHADHLDIQEDFISAFGLAPHPEDVYQFDAYWILGEIHIEHPERPAEKRRPAERQRGDTDAST